MGLLDSVINASVRAMDNQTKLKKSEEKLNIYSAKAEEYNKQLVEQLEKFKELNLKSYESYERENIIQNVISFTLEEKNIILREYSALNMLPDYYKSSAEYKKVIYYHKEFVYGNLIKLYQNGAPLAYIFFTVRNLQYFDIFKDEINHLMKHFHYFTDSGKDVRSVFTESDDIQLTLDQIANTVITPEEFNKIIEDYEFVDQINTEDFKNEHYTNYMNDKMVEKSEYRKALEIILHSNYDEEFLERSKMMLIKFVISGNDYSFNSQKNEYYKNIIDKMFRASRFIPDKISNGEDSFSGFVNIDLLDDIIADSFRYQRSGMINLINEPLKLFLTRFNVSDNKNNITQYETLCHIYQFLKCYDQEKIVLEYMVMNNIPRSEKLEQRLKFLSTNHGSGGINGNISDAPVEFDLKTEDDQYVYDYRLLSWSESQIRSYFNVLSNENRISEMPMVFDDWNKNLNSNTVKWDINNLKSNIEQCILDNYNDTYHCKIIETGAASDGWIELEESLMISSDESSKYSWMKFIITGEQLTKSQITFSIYIVYDPNCDFVNQTDCFQINKQMASKLIGLKMKQNPKINNFVTTFKEILIKGLEEYLNSNAKNDSLY